MKKMSSTPISDFRALHTFRFRPLPLLFATPIFLAVRWIVLLETYPSQSLLYIRSTVRIVCRVGIQQSSSGRAEGVAVHHGMIQLDGMHVFSRYTLKKIPCVCPIEKETQIRKTFRISSFLILPFFFPPMASASRRHDGKNITCRHAIDSVRYRTLSMCYTLY